MSTSGYYSSSLNLYTSIPPPPLYPSPSLSLALSKEIKYFYSPPVTSRHSPHSWDRILKLASPSISDKHIMFHLQHKISFRSRHNDTVHRDGEKPGQINHALFMEMGLFSLLKFLRWCYIKCLSCSSPSMWLQGLAKERETSVITASWNLGDRSNAEWLQTVETRP